MLVITGFAGKGRYNQEIANRIVYYNENGEYQGYFSNLYSQTFNIRSIFYHIL